MGYPYSSPCSYFLIYAYEIPGSVDHKGILKVGDTSFKSLKKAAELPVNCPDLKAAARQRIDQQTNTAGIKYVLHHAELAVRQVENGGEKVLAYFRDHDVHDVLEKSGFKHVKIAGTTGREWYRADLETIKKAIAAVKEGRIALDSSELRKPDPFVFRKEQEKAIGDTLTRFKKHNDMLWDAKMRFGKTPTALEVVRRGEFRKTIIITHRPVVGSSWEEDFHKIFPKNRVPYIYVDKTKVVAKGYEAKEEASKKDILSKYDKSGKHFIYFASIQDLRGSKRVGGEHFKNDAVFDMSWDLVIVDEAHEGTQTELGKKVSAELVKKNGKTKVLSLSGTPFNLLPSFEDGAVFEWDYVKEQTAKMTWEDEHPGEPNPYAVLPKMNIFTFDLAEELKEYGEEGLEGKAFNFTEFFRTWTGDKEADGRALPKGVKAGDFVHAADVRKFLDLLAKPSTTSRYPFATPEYCDYFRHTLWMVPGVAAAKALHEMIRNDPYYATFGVANVAGEGDDFEEEHEDNALELVRSTIRKYPRSITLSCGKLTTGVTVPEWTAVLMISGSVHTSASSYMQTIFRVQSPWEHDGQVKEECYVFDFAPDRALTVLAETAQLSRKISKDGDKEAKGRQALREFMNFCPVIALDGGRARQFEVEEMMRRLKHVFVMRAIRNGFDDVSIYNNEKLMKLGKIDLMKFADLEGIVGKTKQTEPVNTVTVNELGFDQAEFERRKKEKEKKLKRKLTKEEEEALKKRREELKQARDARSILRAISIRMPMLIYGSDVPVDEKITIERFVKMVDEKSWEEFMPKGVTKKRFADFIEYYDRDVFEDAGIQIRKLAKSADKLAPGQRVQQIARIFGYFKNPDKETVLTPWRVVNMHMSDTLGGWCFFDKAFDAQKPLEEPRFVDRGEVTEKAFKTTSRVLEINSKSGLYPLYVAYSIYRRKCGEIPEADIAPYAREKKWRETVRDNVFIICKTPMAASITRRTLVGYSTAAVNAVPVEDIIDKLKDDPKKFTKKITSGKFWKKEDEEMKFDAVVGNPPYQEMKGGEQLGFASAIYPFFVDAAFGMNPHFVSMIMPSRWLTKTGQGVNEEWADKLIHSDHFISMCDYHDARECFPGVEIKGGVLYFLYSGEHQGKCQYKNCTGNRSSTMYDHLDSFGCGVVVRNEIARSVLKKIFSVEGEHYVADSFEKYVGPTHLFDKGGQLGSSWKGFELKKDAKHSIKYYLNKKVVDKGYAWIEKSDIPKGHKAIGIHKVYVPEAYGAGEVFPHQILGVPFYGEPNSVCSQTYLCIGYDPNVRKFTKKECENIVSYIKTKFFRFLVLIKKNTQHSFSAVYQFVPMQDFSEPWDDAKLYKKYKLTKDEIAFIESMIKPMA